MNRTDRFRDLVSLVERGLRNALKSPDTDAVANFYGMMHYHLGWVDKEFNERAAPGGKYVRPLLTLLSCSAAGGRIEHAIPAAVAVELIHNFSLVHDDIEDGSDLRRHRPTVWKLWGDAHAINVGDGLFALAHFQLGRLLEAGVNPTRVVAATSVVDEACVALTQGQFLDLFFETVSRVSLADYLRMIRNKTAALLSCACEVGAIIATDNPEPRSILRQFGYNLGMAFQIEDDILGIWGNSEVTGKPACSDILSQKKTLPVVYAWERGFSDRMSPDCQDAALILERVYSADSVSPNDVQSALQALEVLEAQSYCQALSGEYTRRALKTLSSSTLASAVRLDLENLAGSLLGRTH